MDLQSYGFFSNIALWRAFFLKKWLVCQEKVGGVVCFSKSLVFSGAFLKNFQSPIVIQRKKRIFAFLKGVHIEGVDG